MASVSPAASRLLPWDPALVSPPMTDYKPNKTFPLLVAFDHGLYHNNRKTDSRAAGKNSMYWNTYSSSSQSSSHPTYRTAYNLEQSSQCWLQNRLIPEAFPPHRSPNTIRNQGNFTSVFPKELHLDAMLTHAQRYCVQDHQHGGAAEMAQRTHFIWSGEIGKPGRSN